MKGDLEPATATALNGKIIKGGKRFTKLSRDLPQAWNFFRSSEGEWAAFIVTGDHIADVDEAGIVKAHSLGIKPVLLLTDYSAVKAASPVYRKHKPYLIYEIAGMGAVIPPLNIPKKTKRVQRISTRIPHDLIAELAKDNSLPTGFKQTLTTLEKQYRKLAKTSGNNDDREEKLLLEFSKSILEGMGLKAEKLSTAKMIRTLERGGLGAKRDHFFHSFQNYFLGLGAVARLRKYFEHYKQIAKINWEVDPFNVWFLTVLWHDCGYALQKAEHWYQSAAGHDDSDEEWIKEAILNRVLERPATQEALRYMSSLLSRLLYPSEAKTAWMPPGVRASIGARGDQLNAAILQNIRESHGAIGAIRLYCDYSDDIDAIEPNTSDVLRQTVLLACCSMPFHDLFFRTHVRIACGCCRLLTGALPFAALLAFIDSIQDDRRDIETVSEAVLALEKLLIEQPATVSAEINPDALTDKGLLEKILEGRDIIASLDQTAKTLFFKYPQWIAGQT